MSEIVALGNVPVKLTALTTLLGASSLAASTPETFTDRFEHLDLTRWSVSDGWTNGGVFMNDWRKSQVRSGRWGGVDLILQKTPVSKTGYSSGELQSYKVYRLGYYETKMQAAAGSGVVTGFFTYTGPSRGREWNEIDVEIVGRNTRSVLFTYHTGSQSRSTPIALPFDAAAGSHDYAFDWQPGYINWYVDGRLAHTETGGTLPLPDLPQQIMADVWNSNALASWMGRFVWTGQPPTANVRCIAHSARFDGVELCS